jgi:eight-cysteine-cluster-containing protein
LAGQMVSVVGTVEQNPEGIFCTMLECLAENPCCQVCGASLVISSSSNSYVYLKGTYEGKSVYCSGSNCGIDCYPIEAGSVCQVNGELEKKEGITGIIKYYLNLESFCCSTKNEIPDSNPPPVEPEPSGNIECFSDLDCLRTGCSGEVCAPEPWITACVWLPEFACYQIAPCACISGRCGFVETPEFLACMDAINN